MSVGEGFECQCSLFFIQQDLAGSVGDRGEQIGKRLWEDNLRDRATGLFRRAVRKALPARHPLGSPFRRKLGDSESGEKRDDALYADFRRLFDHQIHLLAFEHTLRERERKDSRVGERERCERNFCARGRKGDDSAVVFSAVLITQGQTVADVESHDMTKVMKFRASEENL